MQKTTHLPKAQVRLLKVRKSFAITNFDLDENPSPEYLNNEKHKGLFAVKKKLTFSVEGMKCGSCVKKIQDSFEELDFDVEATFSVEEKIVSLSFDPTDGESLEIKKQIEQAGFQVTKIS